MKQLLLCLLLIAGFFFSGCKKNPASQQISNLTGSVELLDANDHLQRTNINGAVVTVENSNPLISAMVNSAGSFTLPDFTPNEKTILAVSLPGYGTVKQFYSASLVDSIKAGISNFGDFILAPRSSVVVNAVAGVLDGNHYRININVSLSNSNPNNAVTLFVEKNNPAVSCNNFNGNSDHSRFVTIPVANGDNMYTICLRCTEECGFLQPGDVVYIRAYGDTKSLFATNYEDQLTGNLIFPALNSTGNIPAAISFTFP